MSNIKIFLDSGAFSAFKQGTEIELQEYIDFIKKHHKYIHRYAVLDVIRDPEESWLNFIEMRRQGLDPMPIFHKKEPYFWLKKYIRVCDYVGLGGVAGDLKIGETRRHLDRCFDIICDTPNRLPRVKVHGFGITINEMLFRYPWHSVDSSLIVQTSRRGIIMIPRFVNGKENFRKPPRRIEISSKSPHKKKSMAHYETLSEMERKRVRDYVHGLGLRIGKSEFREDGEEVIVERGVCNWFRDRDVVNFHYMSMLQKALPKKPFAFRANSGGMF